MLRLLSIVAVVSALVFAAVASKAHPAQADDHPTAEQALLTKTNFPGFQPAFSIRTEHCELFADRVVITRQFGLTHGIRETRQIQLFADLKLLIAEAAAEELKSNANSLCDGPGTVVSAGDVLLYSSGGCGVAGSERVGHATKQLRDMIDLYCPITH
jgi:hypothetical protein